MRRTLLVLLPLGSLVVPMAVAPALPAHSVLIVELAILLGPLIPFATLALVAVLAHRWSGSAAATVWTTVSAALLGLVGGIVWLAVVWPTGG